MTRPSSRSPAPGHSSIRRLASFTATLWARATTRSWFARYSKIDSGGFSTTRRISWVATSAGRSLERCTSLKLSSASSRIRRAASRMSTTSLFSSRRSWLTACLVHRQLRPFCRPRSRRKRKGLAATRCNPVRNQSESSRIVALALGLTLITREQTRKTTQS